MTTHWQVVLPDNSKHVSRWEINRRKMTSKFVDEKIIGQVKDFFMELNHPVKILFFGSDDQNCEYCSDTLSLLTEIAGIDEKISIQAFDRDENKELAKKYSVQYTPTTILTTEIDGETIDYGVRILGIPAGHEFTSLIVSLVNVSKQESGLSSEVKQKIAKLTEPVELKVFVTPTCPYCPNAVILAHQMAIESKMITGEMVEAMEFSDLSEQFNVSGVPHTIINLGAGEVIGAAPESLLIAEIEKAILMQVS